MKLECRERKNYKVNELYYYLKKVKNSISLIKLNVRENFNDVLFCVVGAVIIGDENIDFYQRVRYDEIALNFDEVLLEIKNNNLYHIVIKSIFKKG